MLDFVNLYCIFENMNDHSKRFFQLGNDRHIIDINSKGHDNERYFDFNNDTIKLYNKDNIETSSLKLDEKKSKNYDYHYCFFTGFNMNKIPLQIIAVKNINDLNLSKTKFRHYQDIKNKILTVGDHTYGSIKILEKSLGKIVIGDYCSIAGNVHCIIGNHNTNLISTYPFKTLSFYYNVDKKNIKNNDHSTKRNGTIYIGNDVWIGHSVRILPGVKINDGAIIGASSVVSNDVPPYAIVVGNPAKIVKYRFSQSVIHQLLDIAWWNWDEETISARMNDIVSPDIDNFIQKYSTNINTNTSNKTHSNPVPTDLQIS